MSNTNLKSLNWEALLHNSSNDEYDSDETLCEEEVGVDTIIANAPHSDSNLKTAKKSNVELLTALQNVENGPGTNTGATVMLSEGYNSNHTHSCSLTKIETNLNFSGRNDFSESSRFAKGDVGDCEKHNFASESSFGFSDMTLDSTVKILSESIIKAEVEKRPEEAERCLYNGSSGKKRSFITGPYVMKESDSDQQLSSWHSPIGVASRNIELQISSDTIDGQYNNNEMFNDISIIGFEQTSDSLSGTGNTDELREFSSGKKTVMSLNLVDDKFGHTNILEDTDNDDKTFNNKITDYFGYSSNEIQMDTDTCSLKSENLFLGISSESLENILGSDFIEKTFENTNDSRRNTCSPPLTLIENSDKNHIMSTKILPQKIRSNKRDNPEKILPARTCSSRYINQSKRTVLSEELSVSKCESSSPTDANGLKTTVRKVTKKVSYRKSKSNAQCGVKVLGKPIKRKAKKGELKSFLGEKSPQTEKTVKVPFLQNLKGIEQALHQIEENTYKWVSGDEEHFVTREKAFKLLMETQGIVKILDRLQVPMRNNSKMIEMKNKLFERAKKLALAIDAAIAESDQMFKQECYNKLLDEQSIESDEEKDTDEDQNMVKNPTFVRSNDSTGSSFDHNIYENSSTKNSIIQQSVMEKQKPNVQYAVNDESVRSVFTWRHTPKTNLEKYSLNQINQQTIKHIPKSILKYSSSESATDNGGSNDKHISFSEDIEFCYLSDSTSCSGQTSSPSQFSFETDRKFTKTCATENITHGLVHYPNSDIISSENTSSDNAFTSYELQKKETSVRFESISSEPEEKSKGDSSGKFDSKKSVVGDIKSEEQGLSTSLKCLRISDWTQLQKLNNHDVDIMNCAEEIVEIQYPSSSSNSQSSTEGFGFSEDALCTNQRVWGEVSIASIKYLRIKSPSEFTPAEEDIDTWLDLDKW